MNILWKAVKTAKAPYSEPANTILGLFVIQKNVSSPECLDLYHRSGAWLGFQNCGCRFLKMLQKTDTKVPLNEKSENLG